MKRFSFLQQIFLTLSISLLLSACQQQASPTEYLRPSKDNDPTVLAYSYDYQVPQSRVCTLYVEHWQGLIQKDKQPLLTLSEGEDTLSFWISTLDSGYDRYKASTSSGSNQVDFLYTPGLVSNFAWLTPTDWTSTYESGELGNQEMILFTSVRGNSFQISSVDCISPLTDPNVLENYQEVFLIRAVWSNT